MANSYERRATNKEFSFLFFNVDFNIITPRKFIHFFEFCFQVGTVWGTQRRWNRGVGRRLRACVVICGVGFHMEIG